MKEEGDHFIQSLALALVVLALLFFFLWRLIPPLVVVPKADLLEVQLAGSGGSAGDGAPAAGKPRGGANGPAPHAPLPAPTPAAAGPEQPWIAPSSPAAAPPPQPAPPVAEATPTPLQESAQGGVSEPAGVAATGTAESAPRPGTDSQAAAGAGGGGAGVGVGSAGGAGSGTQDLSAGAQPTAVADIDPIPLHTISPSYPQSARRLGQQGLVKIRAEIDRNGRVTDCMVVSSSGFSSLDRAALDAVRNERFMPAMKNGRPVDSILLVPIRFRLTSD